VTKETLFEFYRERDHTRWLCELLDHGEHGVEAQFYRNEEFLFSRRWPDRARAAEWAESERGTISGPATLPP
jgi:hypothetical protein